MHRAVLQACLPWFIWLCVASGVALLLVQYCGGRLDWRRLRRLSSCEDGAVQSLSLVLTLPVFLLLILFIVQITQIMVGIMMVNYAAFAGARAASVWIPADVTLDRTFNDDASVTTIQLQNLIEPANVVAGFVDGSALPSGGIAVLSASNSPASVKCQRIVLASVIPCLTISPSRSMGTGNQLPTALQNTYNALVKLYPLVDPASQSNSQMPQRLRNKLTYAANFTSVDLIWQNVAHPIPDIIDGPTYNPYMHPSPAVPPWNPNEIGFRDPVTVSVTHQFALLPGIGRILATPTNPLDSSQPMPAGTIDRAANRITQRMTGGPEVLYTIRLEASATFVNEGYKSVKRYAVQP